MTALWWKMKVCRGVALIWLKLLSWCNMAEGVSKPSSRLPYEDLEDMMRKWSARWNFNLMLDLIKGNERSEWKKRKKVEPPMLHCLCHLNIWAVHNRCGQTGSTFKERHLVSIVQSSTRGVPAGIHCSERLKKMYCLFGWQLSTSPTLYIPLYIERKRNQSHSDWLRWLYS